MAVCTAPPELREIAHVAAKSKQEFTVSPEKSTEIKAAVPNN